MKRRAVGQALRELSENSPFESWLGKGIKTWWRQLIEWPPDVFAVTSLLLGESGAYRLAASPPSGCEWPHRAGWNQDVEKRAKQWWQWVAKDCQTPPPKWLLSSVGPIARAENRSIADIVDNWKLVCALLELHAVADEASAGMGLPADPEGEPPEWVLFQLKAYFKLHHKKGTLSNFSPDVIRVLPKMRTPQVGITLRSLSAHLAMTRLPEVDIAWDFASAFVTKTSSFNLLLLPVPPSVHPSNFRPSRSRLTNQDGTLFGSFQFEPTALDYDYVKEMLVKGKAC